MLVASATLTFSSTSLAGQEIDLKEQAEALESYYELTSSGDLAHVEVIKAPDKSARQLYQAAEEWVVRHYNDAQSVVDAKSPEEGYILCKGLYEVYMTILGSPTPVKVNHLFKVEVKEGKARISISLLGVEDSYPFYQYGDTDRKRLKYEDRFTARRLIAVHDAVTKHIASVAGALQSTSAASDDW